MTEIDFDREPPVLVHNGDVLLNCCFSITLYSLNLAAPQQKEAVLAIFDDYCALYGPRMRWTFTQSTASSSWQPVTGADSRMMSAAWIRDEPEVEGYYVLFHGGAKRHDAADVSFMALAEDCLGVDDHDLGLLSCRFPLADVHGGRLDLPALMRRWCTLLRPWHGRGGYSAGLWYGNGVRSRLHNRLSLMLLRYPGLQYDNRTEAYYNDRLQAGLYHGPRCADWLIALSDPFLRALGGLDAVAEAMRPCPVLPYEGGAVLQAGDAPGSGRDGDPASLPDYLHLGRVIEPVRARRLGHNICVSVPGVPGSLREAQGLNAGWCARFDGDASTPPHPPDESALEEGLQERLSTLR